MSMDTADAAHRRLNKAVSEPSVLRVISEWADRVPLGGDFPEIMGIYPLGEDK